MVVLLIVSISFVGLAVCLIIIFVGIGCARRLIVTLSSSRLVFCSNRWVYMHKRVYCYCLFSGPGVAVSLLQHYVYNMCHCDYVCTITFGRNNLLILDIWPECSSWPSLGHVPGSRLGLCLHSSSSKSISVLVFLYRSVESERVRLWKSIPAIYRKIAFE